MKLTEKHKLLLAHGINNGGVIRTDEEGTNVYGNTSAAIREIRYLIATGNVELLTFGTFKILKAPPDSFDMAELLKKTFAPKKEKTEEPDPKKVDNLLKAASKPAPEWREGFKTAEKRPENDEEGG